MWFGRIEAMLDRVLESQARVEARLEVLMRQVDALIAKENAMSKQLDDLTAEVATVATVEQSAITLINGLAAQLAAAGTDPAKLQALHDSLKSSSDALAAAVATNTVAATPPVAPTTGTAAPTT